MRLKNLMRPMLELMKEHAQMSKDWIEATDNVMPGRFILKSIFLPPSREEKRDLENRWNDLLRQRIATGLPEQNAILDKYERALIEFEELTAREIPH
ncbi:MAG: hypothetical protein ACHQFZ_02765 [Acidimicrobiales bacterium]